MGAIRFSRGLVMVCVIAMALGRGIAAVNINGIITDSAGTPVPAAAIRLEESGMTATSGVDGKFTLTGTSGLLDAGPRAAFASLHGDELFLSLPERSAVTITAFGIRGQAHSSIVKRLDAGSHSLALPWSGSGVGFFKVVSGNYQTVLKAVSIDGTMRGAAIGAVKSIATGIAVGSGTGAGSGSRPDVLAKTAAEALYDVITVTKSGYLKGYLSISSSELTGVTIKLLKESSPKFSFFVTSMKAMQDLSTKDGFGGDFRFGETGPGAGLRGADKLCAAIAERSMPSSAHKGWRAFLSVTADAKGKPVNAIDRVGEGPWYDRIGRVMAPKKTDLVADRPLNGDPAIQKDLPNENGIPNHRPDPTLAQVDNHHTITGSDATGKLKGATATCKDWTTSVGSAENGKPAAGFSWPRGGRVGLSSGSHWMATGEAPGCAAGIEIVENGPAPQGSIIIGGGGGYGGIYCFALNP